MPPEASRAATPPQAGIVLAFDFGTRRIGVAIGELMLGQARPLTVVTAMGNEARFATIAALIRQWQPTRLVVGLPHHLDGTDNELSERCRRFARQLQGRHSLPVILIDERLTSAAAAESQRQRGLGWRQGKESLDAEAAAIMLQNHFDESHYVAATSGH
jgi:putative holliday junction resolvase